MIINVAAVNLSNNVSIAFVHDLLLNMEMCLTRHWVSLSPSEQANSALFTTKNSTNQPFGRNGGHFNSGHGYSYHGGCGYQGGCDSSFLALTCFFDADWVGNPDDRRSTSRQCIFLGNHLITWSAKKQSTVAKSSTESEYKSLAHSAA